jgi:two-component system, chemotaxis family, sensor kinase Cph1
MDARISETNAKVILAPLPVVTCDSSQFMMFSKPAFQRAQKLPAAHCPEIGSTARREGASSIVSIRDNGIGFDPHYAQNIVGFFQTPA